MRSTSYPRVPRALFCSALLLSQYAVVDANNWATGRASSSRSSTLAVMQPGGRNRPIRDWKAIKREAEEKRKNKAEEKADEAVEAAQETLERVVDEPVDQQLDTVSAESLDMEEHTAEDMGIRLAKVVVIATAGVYGVKKVVAFAKAFAKVRKDRKSSGEEGGRVADGLSAVAATKDAKDKGDDNDNGGGDAEVASGGNKEGDAAAEEEEDETTDGFVTADEEEEDSASEMLAGMGKAADDMKKRAKGSFENLKRGLGEATGRGQEDVQGAGEGDSPPGLPKGVDGGKVDVSYV
ncbi:unnamed protein product [Ectocarpus sp. 13 AM-2016]